MEVEPLLTKVEPQSLEMKSQEIQHVQVEPMQFVEVESQSVEVEVFRRFYSDIQDCIAQPEGVAAMLFSEGIVPEEVLGEVEPSTKPCTEKNTAILRAIRVAIKADPKRVWEMLIRALEKYPGSAPVAKKMRATLEIQRVASE